MSLFLRKSLLVLVSSALAACALTSSWPTQPDSAVGRLADIRNTTIYSDQELQSLMELAPSHALVIGGGGPYRLLLTDGRVAWAEDVSTTEKVEVATTSENAAITNMPLSDRGDKNFKWLEPSQMHSAYVTGATSERFSETPLHIQSQGRKIFLQGIDGYFYWPQLKLEGDNFIGWASATELSFKPAKVKPEDVYGLLQRPFIPLVKSRNPLQNNQTASFDYLDLTHTRPERHTLSSQSWQTEQLLLPPPQLSTNISSIALASSGPCHLFFVAWHNDEKTRFGYCAEAEAGPTPLILSYRYSSQQESLVLDILEVAGDDDREIRVAVTNNFRGEESISVLGKRGN